MAPNDPTARLPTENGSFGLVAFKDEPSVAELSVTPLKAAVPPLTRGRKTKKELPFRSNVGSGCDGSLPESHAEKRQGDKNRPWSFHSPSVLCSSGLVDE